MADIPQSIDHDLDRSNIQINQRCGNCKHLNRVAHPAYGKLCKDAGMTDLSRPCLKFSADPTLLKFKGDRHAKNAIKFLQDLSPDKLLLFASMLVEESKTRRRGFHFGMTVYLCAFGGDYLSNYRRLKVVSASGKYVNLVATDGFTAMVFTSSVLTPTQWQKKKKWLIDNERLTDPNYRKYTESPSHAALQLSHVKHNLTAQDFDSTNKHEFASSIGKNRVRRAVSISRQDRERITPIDKLLSVRTR